jgi:hypothetical protein
MALVIGGEACNLIMDPYSIPLPSTKGMWDAKTVWAWEREYDAAFAFKGAESQRRFDTLGDLVVAKHNSINNGAILGLGDTSDEDVALDDWHSKLDSVGMIVAAVLAGL